TSRTGVASPRMRWARSDSPTTTPVRKAPSATETPNNAAPPAMARARVMTTSAKNSRLRNAEARRNSHGSAQNESGTTTKKNNAALPNRGPTALELGDAKANTATRTTLDMSCTDDQAIPRRAWRLSSSPRSVSNLPRTVLDEFEITAPNAYD